MKIIVTLDDKNGMTFNHRRQSRDSVLTTYLSTLAAGATLWMNAYSATLFPDGLPAGAVCDGDMLERAGKNDVCFVENMSLAPHMAHIDTVFVARWNRVYPSDRKLDIDLTGWRETPLTELTGSSHEKITILRYDRP